MKIVVIFTLIASVSVPVSAVCDACFNQVCYTRKMVLQASLISGQIAINRVENLLHLHYKDMMNSDNTVAIDLNYESLNARTLHIAYSFARTVDQYTGDVYFSGTKGVYRYNPFTKKTERYAYFDKTIWHMQFKNKLYFVEYQKKGLYCVENKRTVLIHALHDYNIDDFIIDKYDDIYFSCDDLVYRLKKGFSRISLFSKTLYALVTDKDDHAVFLDTSERTVYYLDYSSDILVEFGMFDEGTVVFRMVFDKSNNIIYCDADQNTVYILSPGYTRCSLSKKIVDNGYYRQQFRSSDRPPDYNYF